MKKRVNEEEHLPTRMRAVSVWAETRAILPAGGITIVCANECKAATRVPQGQEADSRSAALLLV